MINKIAILAWAIENLCAKGPISNYSFTRRMLRVRKFFLLLKIYIYNKKYVQTAKSILQDI